MNQYTISTPSAASPAQPFAVPSRPKAAPKAPAPWVESGFVQVPREFFAIMHELSKTALTVYLGHLANALSSGERAGKSYRYRDSFAATYHCSTAKVDRGNAELESRGLISKLPRTRCNAQGWRLNAPSAWEFDSLKNASPKMQKRASGDAKTRPITRGTEKESFKTNSAGAENVAAISISSNVSALTEKLVAVGVNPAAAAKLASQNEEAARRALDALQNARGVKSAAAWVVAAIARGGYDAPHPRESAPQSAAIANGGAYTDWCGESAPLPNEDEKAARRVRATAHVEACLGLMEWARRDGYEKGMDGMDLKSRVDYLQRSAPREWSEAAHCIKRATAKTPDLPPATGKSNERVF